MCITLEAKDRLIVALDVRTHDDALELVDTLENASFFKVGLQLFLAGNLYDLLERLQARQRGGGVDLKVAGDISHTVAGFVGHATSLGIRFMTLVEAAQPALTRRTLAAGVSARSNGFPQFLMVPLLSSLG